MLNRVSYLIVLVSLAASAPVGAETRVMQPSSGNALSPSASTTETTATPARPKGPTFALINEAYAPAIEAMAIPNRDALAEAIRTGRIVPVPREGANVRLRLDGDHPIAEKDLEAQHLYVAALPETVGLLLHIASRVTTGPIEVTSLVRHLEYQGDLARSNSNAKPTVPTHTMGLAFDISRKTSPEILNEVRAVLEEMQDDGDLFYIAERQQAVFHVVPTPERRAFYAAVYETLTTVPPLTVDTSTSTAEPIPIPEPEEPFAWLTPLWMLLE